MKNQLLVTAIGEDRPGIVARLAEVFSKHGANLEESRMALLGGEFAAIILISIAEGNIPALKDELSSLTKEDISVTTKATKLHDPARFAGYTNYEISVSGADHEGIVHKVSAALHARAINIQSVETDVINAPITGTPLFCMKANIAVPAAISLIDLQQHLRTVENDESVEIVVTVPSGGNPKAKVKAAVVS